MFYYLYHPLDSWNFRASELQNIKEFSIFFIKKENKEQIMNNSGQQTPDLGFIIREMHFNKRQIQKPYQVLRRETSNVPP